MRLWSLHPRYLDAKGLVALWREGLLAQKVLSGNTKGYRHHPQLHRFIASSNPLGAGASYLRVVAQEAKSRNYKFDNGKICNRRLNRRLQVTSGQIEYEYQHLLRKLKLRDRKTYLSLKSVDNIEAHPLFHVHDGDIEEWEITE